MKFEPITEDEWNHSNQFVKEGEVDFMITNVIEAISKSSGIPMLRLELECTQGSASLAIKDILSSSPKAKWKISQFLKSLGDPSLKNKAARGELIYHDLINKRGKALLKKDYYIDSQGQTKPCLKLDTYIARLNSASTIPDLPPSAQPDPYPYGNPVYANIENSELDDEIPF